MGFITLVSANVRRSPRGGGTWFALLMVLGLATPAAHGAEFTVRSASTRLVNHVYLLSTSIDFQFSKQALSALESGVPLTIRLDIVVQRKRSYWFDEDIANLEQRYRIYYHALSGQYLVRNLNSGATTAYHTLRNALAGLGTITDLPLLDEKLVEPGEHYEVELRASLEIEALPSPLRPLAYINPAWHLGSGWHSWSLTP